MRPHLLQVTSIHQPRSSIFAMFDDLILLSEGRLLYNGPAQDALSYFEQHGHKCPEHYNPAEFLADLISLDQSTTEAQHRSRCHLTCSPHVLLSVGLCTASTTASMEAGRDV